MVMLTRRQKLVNAQRDEEVCQEEEAPAGAGDTADDEEDDDPKADGADDEQDDDAEADEAEIPVRDRPTFQETQRKHGSQLKSQEGTIKTKITDILNVSNLGFQWDDTFVDHISRVANQGYNVFLTSILYLSTTILNSAKNLGGQPVHIGIDVGMVKDKDDPCKFRLLKGKENGKGKVRQQKEKCPRLKFVAEKWEGMVRKLREADFEFPPNIPKTAATLERYVQAHMKVVRFYATKVEPPPGMSFLDIHKKQDLVINVRSDDTVDEWTEWSDRMMLFLSGFFGQCPIKSIKEEASKIDNYARNLRKKMWKEQKLDSTPEYVINIDPLDSRVIGAEMRKHTASMWQELHKVGVRAKIFERIRIVGLKRNVAEHPAFLFGLVEGIGMDWFLIPNGEIEVQDAGDLLEHVIWCRKQVLSYFSVVFSISEESSDVDAIFTLLDQSDGNNGKQGSITFEYHPSLETLKASTKPLLRSFQNKFLAAWLVDTARARGYCFKNYSLAKQAAEVKLKKWMCDAGTDFKEDIFKRAFVDPISNESQGSTLEYESIARYIGTEVVRLERQVTSNPKNLLVCPSVLGNDIRTKITQFRKSQNTSIKLFGTFLFDRKKTLSRDTKEASLDPKETLLAAFGALYWNYSGRNVKNLWFFSETTQEADVLFSSKTFGSLLNKLVTEEWSLLRLQNTLRIPATRAILAFLMTDKSLVNVRNELEVSLLSRDSPDLPGMGITGAEARGVASWLSEADDKDSFSFIEIRRVRKSDGRFLTKDVAELSRHSSEARTNGGELAGGPTGEVANNEEGGNTGEAATNDEGGDNNEGGKIQTDEENPVDKNQQIVHDMQEIVDAIPVDKNEGGKIQADEEKPVDKNLQIVRDMQEIVDAIPPVSFLNNQDLLAFSGRISNSRAFGLFVEGESKPRKVVVAQAMFEFYEIGAKIIHTVPVEHRTGNQSLSTVQFGTVTGFHLASLHYLVKSSDALTQNTEIWVPHQQAWRPPHWIGDTVHRTVGGNKVLEGLVRGFYLDGERPGGYTVDVVKEGVETEQQNWPFGLLTNGSVEGIVHSDDSEHSDDSSARHLAALVVNDVHSPMAGQTQKRMRAITPSVDETPKKPSKKRKANDAAHAD